MKKLLKNILKAFNLKLIKINVCTEPAYQTVQALKSHNINVVFVLLSKSKAILYILIYKKNYLFKFFINLYSYQLPQSL